MTSPAKPSYLGHRLRLRQKFERTGMDAFLEHEMLELLLTYAIPRKNTKPIAWALLRRFGSLAAVLDAEPAELASVENVGKNTALFLKIIRSTYHQYAKDELQGTCVVQTPQQLMDYCRAALAGRKEEFLEIIFLSGRSTVIGTQTIAKGDIDAIAVTPRKIIACALAAKATSMVLVHNHPSGDATPSDEDVSFTAKTKQAAQAMGLNLYDHLIVGKGQVFSMAAEGLLQDL